MGTFQAMASSCEVLMDVPHRQEALRLLAIVSAEAWRIEDKFSRYLRGNVVEDINRGDGAPVEVDEETARLLDFAAKLHALVGVGSTSRRESSAASGPRTDSAPTPSAEEIAAVLRSSAGTAPSGTEDGFASAECRSTSAASARSTRGSTAPLSSWPMRPRRAASSTSEATSCSVDRAHRPSPGASVSDVTQAGRATWVVLLTAGGLATSGTTKRFLLADGVRYGHILDPTTGWPVEDVHARSPLRPARASKRA